MTKRWSENPSYAGRKPEPLTPACHDRSPMLDVQCLCGAVDHIHETQLAGATDNTIIGMRCSRCRHVNEVPLSFLREGFAGLRERGWIT